jgi:SAM-dependent methyltransferase
MGIAPCVSPDLNASYRKWWEWCAIFEALSSRGMLVRGKRGLGFAVGTEPLAAAFASRGTHVLATDLHIGASTGDWADNGQHAGSLEALAHPEIIDDARFRELVSFQPADMNHLDEFESESFDFTWSSCALEHIGKLEDGLNFIVNAMRLLKPGGVAVHTTEYNVSSNEGTIMQGDCIYRRQDIERLDYALRPHRCGLEPVDFNAGVHPYDLDYDSPPYFSDGPRHIKLLIGDYVSTSMVLIIRKA